MKENLQYMQVFTQHHGAVQPHDTATPRLTSALLRPQIARMDCHCAWEKQPAKADHSSLDFEFIHVDLCS